MGLRTTQLDHDVREVFGQENGILNCEKVPKQYAWRLLNNMTYRGGDYVTVLPTVDLDVVGRARK